MLRTYILKLFVGGLLVAGLTACSDIFTDNNVVDCGFDNKSYLTLTFVTPTEGTPTRAAADMATRASSYEDDGYEEGIEYENYVDFDKNDYKIYFFTYSTANDTKGGTLLAEFEPTEITPVAGVDVTKYTLTGNVPDALADISNFRIVVLANWGTYPEVTVGTTTIDDLCEANAGTSTTSTYAAMVDSDGKATMTSEENLIPFFGVQEYTGVSFRTGETTTLSTPISLLRSVAKVEIIVTADSYVHELNTASIVNYNSRGYCAPWQVYTAADYDTSASKNPSSTQWGEEWVSDLHLVNKDASGNGINDDSTTPKTILMYKVQDYEATTDETTGVTTVTQLETWRAYVPEYNNMSTDYSYMTVNCDAAGVDENGENEDVDYTVYFADYNASTGKTTAYGEDEETDMPDRLNIKRNNLYRFYVTIEPFTFQVYIDILPWVERRDDYEF